MSGTVYLMVNLANRPGRSSGPANLVKRSEQVLTGYRHLVTVSQVEGLA